MNVGGVSQSAIFRYAARALSVIMPGSLSICLSRSVCVSLSVWSADRICFDLHSQNLNIGVKPMSDVTPDHKYDINDPFGEWTMSQELAKSPREYRCVRACCR